MGVVKHRGRIVCDKRWPDGSRFTRRCPNRTIAKRLLAKMEVSIADGTWQELREQLKLRDRDRLTLNDYAGTYIDDYAKVRNKKKAWNRKVTSLGPRVNVALEKPTRNTER